MGFTLGRHNWAFWTGWEIPLLERKEESGTSLSRWLAKCYSWRSVYTCVLVQCISKEKRLLLWSWHTPSPRLLGSSWQLTADYKTWGHCITASIFPLGTQNTQVKVLTCVGRSGVFYPITAVLQSSSCVLFSKSAASTRHNH